MKVFIVTPLVVALACTLCPTNGQSNPYDLQPAGNIVFNRPHERKLIVGGAASHAGTKTYTTGLRSTVDGENFCVGSLISPTHVLSASHCVEGEIRYASIGSHYFNGTQDGEQIRVLSIMNHRNYSTNDIEIVRDFLVLELERPSTFKPVKMAALDGSDTKTGDWATVLGWGRTTENGTTSHELQQTKLQLITNEECLESMKVDDAVVCAKGPLGESACYGDSGGPLVKESPNGEDVLIGVVSWGNGCGRDGAPTAFGLVARVREWIESISSGTCFSK
ncbi:hypothetical protein PRIC1_011954 [Phytophthora ramorum]